MLWGRCQRGFRGNPWKGKERKERGIVLRDAAIDWGFSLEKKILAGFDVLWGRRAWRNLWGQVFLGSRGSIGGLVGGGCGFCKDFL